MPGLGPLPCEGPRSSWAPRLLRGGPGASGILGFWEFGCRILGFWVSGCWVQGVGFWDFGFRIFGILGSGFRKFRVLGFWVQGI